MKTLQSPQPAALSNEQVSLWFEKYISHIRVDQLQMELGVADTEKTELYKNAIEGNYEEVFKRIRSETSQMLIQKVVNFFLVELFNRRALPEKLAFSLTPATIIVWAEIKDNDEQVEDAILLAESKVNAYARQFDFSVDTMIVEKSDAIPVPSHYILVGQNPVASMSK